MSPLQTALWPFAFLGSGAVVALRSGATLAVASGVAAGAFYLYGRRCRDTGDTTAALSRLRRAFRVGFPLVYAGTLVAMALAGWLDLLSAVTGSLPGGETTAGRTVTTVVGLAVPGVAVAGAYLGAVPAVRALHDADVTAGWVARRLVRYAGGVVALVAVLVGGAAVLDSDFGSGVGFLGAVTVLAALVWVRSSWLLRLVQPTRPPTDAERERVERLCTEAGLDPRAVWVLAAEDTKRTYAVVRGLPGRRHLFVSEHLLAELDDDRLRAYLALRAGRVRVLHLEVRTVAIVGPLAVAAGLLVGPFSVPGVSDRLAVAVTLVASVTALWVGQRLVYRADADAADRTDPETVEAAIRASADLNDAPIDRGRLTALWLMEPSLVDRIDHLRDRDVAARRTSRV